MFENALVVVEIFTYNYLKERERERRKQLHNQSSLLNPNPCVK